MILNTIKFDNRFPERCSHATYFIGLGFERSSSATVPTKHTLNKELKNTVLIFCVQFQEKSNLWIYSLVLNVLNEINTATVQVHIKTASPLLMAILKHHSI